MTIQEMKAILKGIHTQLEVIRKSEAYQVLCNSDSFDPDITLADSSQGIAAVIDVIDEFTENATALKL